MYIILHDWIFVFFTISFIHTDHSSLYQPPNIPRIISFVGQSNDDSESEQNRSSDPISVHTPPRRSSSRLSRRNDDGDINGRSSSRRSRRNDSEVNHQRARSSSRRRNDDIDPLERKRRQLENLRDKNNLRKFVQATDQDTNRRGSANRRSSDKKKGKQSSPAKKKGFFSRLRGKSSSPAKNKDKNKYGDGDEVRDDDYQHFQRDDDYEERSREKRGRRSNVKPSSPEDSLDYEDAEIQIKTSNSDDYHRSKSRPRVKDDDEDYKPKSESLRKKTPTRQRSKSRSRSTARTKEDGDNPVYQIGLRKRSTSRLRPKEEVLEDHPENRSKSRLDKIEKQPSHQSSRSKSRPRTTSKDDDDWSPTHSKSSNSLKNLPPTAPKRARSTKRQRDQKQSSDNLPLPKAPQRGRSKSGRKPPGDHGIQRRSMSNPRGESSIDGSRRSGRSRSSRQRDDRSSNYDSTNSRQYSLQSRTPSTSSRRSKGSKQLPRSISNKGRSGTRQALGSDDEEDTFFVKMVT